MGLHRDGRTVPGGPGAGAPSPLRDWLDRWRGAERRRLPESVLALIRELAEARDAESLVQIAGTRLTELFRPESCAIYLRHRRDFARVFAHASDGAPSLGAESSLLRALAAQPGAVDVVAWLRDRSLAEILPSDRAALRRMNAALLVPVGRRGLLLGAIALGARPRGGYDADETALLETLAAHLASELAVAHEASELGRQARANERLCAYVPGAVASRITRGVSMRCGASEVSVLFVDIHGYTGFSERLRPDEIFRVVSQYTRDTSQIICRHAGTVVDFNGDGIMAVFGAPEAIANKERAAVEAALAISRSIERVPALPGGEPLSIGVGVASGPAFVGNIRAVDRQIWSVIGNTTNLAARLQALTHELDASIVIDRATHAAAGPARAAFRPHPGSPIRGRLRAEDVYALGRRPQPQRRPALDPGPASGGRMVGAPRRRAPERAGRDDGCRDPQLSSAGS